MANYLGVGAYLGSSSYTGTEPGAAAHGQLRTDGGHTIHYGTNILAAARLDSESSSDTLYLGTTTSGAVEIGRSGYMTTVKGNLSVEGTTYTNKAETVLVEDNFFHLNYSYITDAVKSAGLVANIDPIPSVSATASAFVAATRAITVGSVSGTPADGDLIVITGSASNDGLYEVASYSETTLVVKSSSALPFVQTALVDESGATAPLSKVAVASIKASDGSGGETLGSWYRWYGSDTTSTTWSSFGTTGLNNNYQADDNTISIDTGSGPIILAYTADSYYSAMRLNTDMELLFGTTPVGKIQYETIEYTAFLVETVGSVAAATADLRLKTGYISGATGAQQTGSIYVASGNTTQASGSGGATGDVSISSGSCGGVSVGNSGALDLFTGDGGGAGSASGWVSLNSGSAGSGANSGTIQINSGTVSGGGTSGNIYLYCGSGGTYGNIYLQSCNTIYLGDDTVTAIQIGSGTAAPPVAVYSRINFQPSADNIGFNVPNEASAGTPTTRTGQAEGDLVWDSTNNDLWGYSLNNTTWYRLGGASGALSTLDSAYDGLTGSGSGRTIAADSGSVAITASGTSTEGISLITATAGIQGLTIAASGTDRTAPIATFAMSGDQSVGGTSTPHGMIISYAALSAMNTSNDVQALRLTGYTNAGAGVFTGLLVDAFDYGVDSNCNCRMRDDRQLLFGTGEDAYIMYDETTDDWLEIVSNSLNGMQLYVDQSDATIQIWSDAGDVDINGDNGVTIDAIDSNISIDTTLAGTINISGVNGTNTLETTGTGALAVQATGSGNVSILTSAGTGAVLINSTAAATWQTADPAASTASTALTVRSGNTTTANSGDVTIATGACTTSGDSGDLYLNCGTASGGTRGDIVMGGNQLSVSGFTNTEKIVLTGTVTFSWGAGAPAHTPGVGSLWSDTTNGEFYIYTGGGWVKVGTQS